MDQRDVEMEETGKLLEDEGMDGRELVANKQLGVEEVGVKLEELTGLVKDGIRNPKEQEKPSENAEERENVSKNGVQEGGDLSEDAKEGRSLSKNAQEEIGDLSKNAEEGGNVSENPEEGRTLNKNVEEESGDRSKNGEEGEGQSKNGEEGEGQSKKAEEGTPVDQGERGSPVDEAQDTVKDTTVMDDDDDKTHDGEKNALPMDDDKAHDNEKDATAADDDEKDAMTMDDDKTHDDGKDATVMDDDKKHDNEKDAMTHDYEKDATAMDDDKTHDDEKDTTAMDDDDEADGDASVKGKTEGDCRVHEKHQEPATPNDSPATFSPSKAKDHSVETPKNELDDTKMDEGYESGTPEDQETFMKEVETFYREKSLEFKPPKFYGQPLNCLKLWRAVIKLGGYDRVTGCKLWRQVGESFHPPKTCTTVSWTFRQFYEKALLEYERHKMQSGELELPLAVVLPEASTVENEANGQQTPGSGRARRDAAARAMQGWHAQRLFGYSEDKSSNGSQKREKSLKSIGSVKQKRPSEVEHPVKAARTETSRQIVTTVADVGPPADWVKVNVREAKDLFEVYVLVPGLLREEVRVQSDPAGRLVITGQPEQPDNPWGITPFKKVISLPSRIDPLRTSAVVSLHGRLLVRVPFEQH